MREPPSRSRARRWADLAFGAVGVVLLLAAGRILLQTPCVGVADILDYWRVMRPAGIEHVGDLEHPGYYVRCEFQTGAADLLSSPSSSALLAWLAKHLSWGLSPGEGRMDLRQMGLLFLILMAAIFLIGIADGTPTAVAAWLLYVMVDPGYLLFFNSFYADGTLFIALLGTAICLERMAQRPAELRAQSARAWTLWSAALILLAFLGGGSKMQYVLFPAVLLLALGCPLVFRWRTYPARTLSLAAGLVLVLLAVGWNFFLGPGPRFLEFNNYHAVFGGILRVASSPEKVLEELEVPKEYWDLPRTDAWSANVGLDHPVHRHLRDLSRWRLLKHYAFDPAARSATLSEIAGKLALVESHPRGNRVRAQSDRRPIRRTYQVGWQYSKLSRRVLAPWPATTWLVLGGSALWLLACAWRRSWTGRRTAILFLLLWVGSQLVVAVLGEGLINLHQHVIGARLGLDLLLVLVASDLLPGAYRAARRLAGRLRSGPRAPTGSAADARRA